MFIAGAYVVVTHLIGNVLRPRVTAATDWWVWAALSRLKQVKPVACFIRSDLAPRGAVRKVDPRLDLTRSARIDEPGGMAIRPGDGSQGFTEPYRAANQPTGGR